MAKNSIDELKSNPVALMLALAQIAVEDPEEGAILFARTGKTPEEVFPEATGQQGQGANSMVFNPSMFLQGIPAAQAAAGGTGGAPGGGLPSAGGFNFANLIKGLGAVQASETPGTPAPAIGAGFAPPGATAGGLDPAGLAQILQLLQGASGQAPGVNLGQLIGG